MIRFILALSLLAVSLGAPSLVAEAQSPRVHVVKPGETLYRIATTNGITVDALKAFNGLTSNLIEVGQRLRLPASAQAPSTPQPIPQTPASSEPLRQPVQPVQIPTTQTRPRDPAPASAPRARLHTVERGETLFRIALRYDTTVEALRQLNGIQGDAIEVGQRLRVTEGGGRTTASGRVRPIASDRTWSTTRTTVPADLVHFTQPGETLYSIAAQYGFTLDEIVSRNAVNTAPLPPGTMLTLPEPVDPAEAAARTLPPLLDSGLALVFPDVMQGRPTASGESYDPLDFTASHREFAFGTVLLVTNPINGRSTFVRVTDRGPVSQAYLMELSAAAATALDLDPNIARMVEIRALP